MSELRFFVGIIAMLAVTGWYIWYVGFHVPKKLEKMTPKEREKFLKDWEDAGRWER